MSYRGLPEFQISYGFKANEFDEEKSLVAQLRDEQQEEYEARRKGTSAHPTTETPKGKTSSAGENSARDQELIKEAMLWHLQMGHLGYDAVLKLPQAMRNFPIESFEGLEVGDIPPCDTWTRLGDPCDPCRRELLKSLVVLQLNLRTWKREECEIRSLQKN